MSNHGLTSENMLRTLPAALQHNPKMLALGQAIAEALASRNADWESLNIYCRINQLPEDLIDMLADDFKADWYNCDYEAEAKRRILKTERYVHKHLGTAGAIRQFVRAIYPGADVEEWFTYGGEPHHFRLTLNLLKVIGEESLERFVRSCRIVKRLSSWIDDIRITMPTVTGTLHTGGRFAANTRLGAAEKEDVFDFRHTAYLGGKLGTHAELDPSQKGDVFDFRSTFYTGGRMGAHAELSTAEKDDVLDFRHTLYTGGQQMGVQAVLTGKEDLTAPTVPGRLRAGGCFNTAARIGGKARAAHPGAGLRVRQSGCTYTILPNNARGENNK